MMKKVQVWPLKKKFLRGLSQENDSQEGKLEFSETDTALLFGFQEEKTSSFIVI